MFMKPLLPPISGYIESRDAEGNPIYVPTEETLEKQRLERENTLLKSQISALSNQVEFTEELIAELAMKVYQV